MALLLQENGDYLLLETGDRIILKGIIELLCADGLKSSDLTRANLTIGIALTDGLSSSDSSIGSNLVQLLGSDALKLSELTQIQKTLNLNLSDALKSSDLLSSLLNAQNSISDGLSLTDSPITQANLQNILQECVNLTDTPVGNVKMLLSLSDGIRASDSATIGLLFLLSVADAIKISDIVSEEKALGVWASDGVGILASHGRLIGAKSDDYVNFCSDINTFTLCQFRANHTGIINEVRVKTNSVINIMIALYADNSGEPGALINSIGSHMLAAGWNILTFPSTPIIRGTDYWWGFIVG